MDNLIYSRRMILFGVYIIVTIWGTAAQDCIHGQLQQKNENGTSVSLDQPVSLKLRPQNSLKQIRVELSLEDINGEVVYILGLDANMGVVWGDVEVSVRDVRTGNNVLKVSWPPILLPQAWTSLHLRLHYQQLLQLAVIPREALHKPRSFMSAQILLLPMATSIKLARSTTRALRLRLGSDNMILEYKINCGQEFLASLFATEFGIASSAPFWSSVSWVLVGVVVLLLVTLMVVVVEWWRQNSGRSPFTLFEMKEMKTKKPKAVSPTSVSVQQPGGRKVADGAGGDKLGLPNVTVGVVSSRAPSPGHELDENTLDYVNKAFTHDE